MKVTALVLAAGASLRAGAVNKLLFPDASGRCMIVRSVTSACLSQAERVVVVLGHDRVAVAAALNQAGLNSGPRLHLTEAPDHAAGLSASLRHGVSYAARHGADAVLVCLGDMPMVRPSTLDRLIEQMAADISAQACVPTVNGERGNPVLWHRRQFRALLALGGDKGARALLDAGERAVLEIAVDDPGVLEDFDTPQRLARYVYSHQEKAPS